MEYKEKVSTFISNLSSDDILALSKIMGEAWGQVLSNKAASQTDFNKVRADLRKASFPEDFLKEDEQIAYIVALATQRFLKQ